MNKISKLLSVFVIAGTVSAGVVGVAGCHTHTYSEEWSSDSSQHWHSATCEHEDEKSEAGNHVDENGDGKCDVCGYQMVVPHEHTYEDKWTSDETGHWHAATCGHTSEKGQFAAHVDEDGDGKCDVCGYQMEAAHEHTYADEWSTSNTQHWHEATCEHADERGSLGNHVDENGDDKCDVCGFEMYEMVTTEADFARALEIAGGSGSGFKITEDLTVGKFTFGAGSYFEEGLVNNQQKKITFTLSGKDNSVKFDMRGASGSGSTMSLYKVTSDGDECIKTWALVPNSTTVTGNEVTELEAGTYYLQSVGSARVSNLSVSEYVEKSDVTGISVSGAADEFLAGREFTSEGLNVILNYENGRTDPVTSGYTVDSSQVNMEQEGEYTVTVKYGEMQAEYKVKVFAIESISLEMYDLSSSRVTQNVQQIFIGGSQFNSANLGVVALAECGEEQQSFVLEESEYNCSQPSLATSGYVKVTVNALDVPSATAEYEVAVVSAKLAAADEYTITVDPAAQLNVEGATATVHTVNQALQLLRLSEVDADSVKTIKVKPGSYKEKVEVDMPNVHLIGDLTGDATNKDVVIWYDALAMNVAHGGVSHSTDGSATVSIRNTASGFYAKDLTFKNYYNTNALYEESKKLGKDTQAVALLADCDMCVFENVFFTSYHDTLYAMRGRQVYTGCEIEGRTDYIFGYNATAYFYDCTIRTLGANDEKNGGYIVATKGFSSGHSSDAIEYGYIFDNCDIVADENVVDGTVSIARGWGEDMRLMVMNSSISAAYSKEAYGNTESSKNDRYGKMNADPVADQLLEYNNTGDGAISESIADTCTVVTDADLAAGYADFSEIFAAVNGLQKYDTAWAGSVEQVVVDIYSDGEKVGSIFKYEGQTITAEEIIENAVIAEGMTVDSVYTDQALSEKYDYSAELTEDMALYITTRVADPTFYETTTIDFSDCQTSYQGVKGYYQNLEIDATEGKFAPNGSGYMQMTPGTVIKVTVVEGSVVAVTEHKDYVGKAQVSEIVDGVVTITAAEETYVSAIDVIVPLAESTSIDIGNCAVEYNGTVGYYKGVKIDASEGKLRPNGGSVQVNPGTVLTVLTQPGATVSIDWYSETDTQYGAEANAVIEYNEDKTVAVITFRADPDGLVGNSGIYIRNINVTVPQTKVTYNYVYNGENADVWVDNTTNVTNSSDKLKASKIEATNDITLNAAGKKMTVTMTGFTSNSDKAQPYVKIELIAADGSVVGTIIGTTPTEKVNGDITFPDGGVVEATGDFVAIKISCAVSGKSFGMTSATIVVE